MQLKMKILNNIGRCQTEFRASESDVEIHALRHAYVLEICREPGRTQDSLAAELCVNKSSVARVLDWFEGNGYIERRSCSTDKRCLLVYPTEKMLAVYPKIVETTKRWNSLITEGISESELEIFNSVLSRMNERARKIYAEISEDKK